MTTLFEPNDIIQYLLKISSKRIGSVLSEKVDCATQHNPFKMNRTDIFKFVSHVLCYRTNRIIFIILLLIV